AADDHEGPPSRTQALPPRLRNAKAAGVGALRPLNIRSLRVGSGRVSLMRILMTNACSFNCHYCPMRRDRNLPRALLKPEELVRIFLEAHRRGWCQGLFITTGIPGKPQKVMDDLIRVLELLRERHGFRGYIHVKMVPGAETALTSLHTARRLVRREQAERSEGRTVDPLRPGGAAGMTVQFVVGATPDTDRTLLGRVGELYAGGGVHHAHFSAFRPIRDTPLEEATAAPALREQRLYQADYLVRDYGFATDEVVFDDGGNLPLSYDPKTAWALAHPERFPVEVRTAAYDELLRVPGIGPTAARRIVDERAATVFRDLADLRKLGVVTTRAAGFLTLGGRRLQTVKWTEQLGFWAPEDDAGRPHVVYGVSPGTFR
ncbi:MAG TPA: radical SAM protein, partial [Longimicrobium sp.]|nr:radical SAM protein [Longimicrobium sp.]